MAEHLSRKLQKADTCDFVSVDGHTFTTELDSRHAKELDKGPCYVCWLDEDEAISLIKETDLRPGGGRRRSGEEAELPLAGRFGLDMSSPGGVDLL